MPRPARDRYILHTNRQCKVQRVGEAPGKRLGKFFEGFVTKSGGAPGEEEDFGTTAEKQRRKKRRSKKGF